jgi:hypothetical protein
MFYRVLSGIFIDEGQYLSLSTPIPMIDLQDLF